MAKTTMAVRRKGDNVDEKQHTLGIIEKLKTVESNLYRQLEKAEHTARLLQCRKDDDRTKLNSSDTYGFCSALLGFLFGAALGGAIATGDPTAMTFAIGGLATSAASVGINIRTRVVCKKDMKNISKAVSDVWKYYRSLESQLDFVKIKIKRLEQIAESGKINTNEVEQVRSAKYEGKKTIAMDETLRENINKLGASYSDADEVDLMV